jgi:hypothetical protein
MKLSGTAANDNTYSFERPIVRVLRRRPRATYARSGNVILPLQFAERMPGWSSAPRSS